MYWIRLKVKALLDGAMKWEIFFCNSEVLEVYHTIADDCSNLLKILSCGVNLLATVGCFHIPLSFLM